MQTLIQATKGHFLRFNFKGFSPKSLAVQPTHNVYLIESGHALSTTSTVRSSTAHAKMKSKGETSQTTEGLVPIKPLSAMPGPRGLCNIPHVGFMFHLKPFSDYSIGDLDKIVSDMQKRYGPIFRMQTNLPSVVVTDPKDISTVLQNEGKYPFRPDFDIVKIYHQRTGTKPSISAVQGEEWWNLREPMQRVALRPTNISRYLPLMEGVSDDFVKMLLSGYLKNRDLDQVFMAFAAESAGTLFFNKRLGFLEENPTQESKDFLQSIYDMFDEFYNSQYGAIGFKFYRSKKYIRFESAMNHITQTVIDHVTQAKLELDQLGKENVENSMVNSLLKDGVSEQDVAVIMRSFVSASIDSSAAGIQMALYILSKYPDIQEKVRKDVFGVLSDNVSTNNNSNNNNDVPSSNKGNGGYQNLIKDIPQHISKGALGKMHYLTAFLKEVHRFSPLIPMGLIRILPVDVVLGGYNVPAGTQIYSSHKLTCRDESIFKDANEFKPERWLRSTNSTTVSRQMEDPVDRSRRNYSVVPFGLGIRSCPGKRIFQHETTLLVAKLLTKARIGLEPGCEEIEFKYRPFLKAEKPIPFTFTPLDEK